MITISYRFSLHNCSQQSLIRRRGRASTSLDQGRRRPAFGDISVFLHLSKILNRIFLSSIFFVVNSPTMLFQQTRVPCLYSNPENMKKVSLVKSRGREQDNPCQLLARLHRRAKAEGIPKGKEVGLLKGKISLLDGPAIATELSSMPRRECPRNLYEIGPLDTSRCDKNDQSEKRQSDQGYSVP